MLDQIVFGNEKVRVNLPKFNRKDLAPITKNIVSNGRGWGQG